jgi:hypothetical protein
MDQSAMLKSLLVITRFVLLMCCSQQHFFIHCKQFQLSHQLLYKDLRPQQEEGRESKSHMVHGFNSLGMRIFLIIHQSRSHTSQMDLSMFSMKEKLARRSRPELCRMTHVSKGYENGMRA